VEIGHALAPEPARDAPDVGGEVGRRLDHLDTFAGSENVGKLGMFAIVFGSAGGHSCAGETVDRLMALARENSDYSITLNGRFKGGYITRCYGDPAGNIHTLQLEINQDTYLAAGDPPRVDAARAERLSRLLYRLVSSLR